MFAKTICFDLMVGGSIEVRYLVYVLRHFNMSMSSHLYFISQGYWSSHHGGSGKIKVNLK